MARGLLGKGAWLVVTLAPVCGETLAHAGLVTYSDASSWNQAVSGVSTLAIPDPAPDPFTYFGTGTASVSYGGVTFSTDASISDSSFYNIGSLFSGLPAVLSSQGASTGPENILVTFSTSVYGFALNYGTFDGSDVTFSLSNGHSFIQGSDSGSSYDVPGFAGATDTLAFTSVLITSYDSTLDINNVSYATALATVPEPGSLVLCALGAITALIVQSLISGTRQSWLQASP